MKKLLTNKKIALFLVLILLAVGVLFILQSSGRINLLNNPTVPPDKEAETLEINYGPPTQEEQQAGDKKKDEIKSDSSFSPNSGNVSVIITDAAEYDDIVEVRAFIPNHYQDGTCTLTFTQDEKILTRVTTAYRDVSTTICTNPLIKKFDFPTTGIWKVIVNYQSKDASATSEAKEISIN
jgi:hypothetical protein